MRLHPPDLRSALRKLAQDGASMQVALLVTLGRGQDTRT